MTDLTAKIHSFLTRPRAAGTMVTKTPRWRASIGCSLLLAFTLVPICKSDSSYEVSAEAGKNTKVEVITTEETLDLGVEQNVYSTRADEVMKVIEDAKEYVKSVVKKDPSLKETCKLKNEHCAYWAVVGNCNARPDYMNENCAPVCQTCGEPSVEETVDPEQIALGVEQNIYQERADEVKKRIEDAKAYRKQAVEMDPSLEDTCKLNKEHCANWAVLGECDKNSEFMKVNCAPVCQVCYEPPVETVEPEVERCPLAPNVWEPGDMNFFFSHFMTSSEYAKYSPKVLSSPHYLYGDTEETADYLVEGPWLIVLENVISPEESYRLIELGAIEGFDPDYDDVIKNLDGVYEEDVNTGRTSTTAWCVHDCYADEIAQGVIQTITDLVDIPEENHEHLQLLKYEKGQFYKEHHDYVEEQRARHSGVRMLTVLLFLDDVEMGGETRFPMLNITVEPKQGRALLWPNVRNGAPDKKDDRTIHQALPVVKGVKYAAKAWVHQRDYKTPKENGCSNVEITPP